MSNVVFTVTRSHTENHDRNPRCGRRASHFRSSGSPRDLAERAAWHRVPVRRSCASSGPPRGGTARRVVEARRRPPAVPRGRRSDDPLHGRAREPRREPGIAGGLRRGRDTRTRDHGVQRRPPRHRDRGCELGLPASDRPAALHRRRGQRVRKRAVERGTGTNKTDATPATPSGYWYLVRAVNRNAAGSYDTTGPSQSGTRDAEIAASAFACP